MRRTCPGEAQCQGAMCSKILRIVLGSQHPVLHHQLRAKASLADEHSKCYFDVALLSLLEHGLLQRSGYGNWALYSIPMVPSETYHVATELAFADFPCEPAEHSLFPSAPPKSFIPPLPAAAASPCMPPLRPRSWNNSPAAAGAAAQRVRPGGKRGASFFNSGSPAAFTTEELRSTAFTHKRARLSRVPSFGGEPAPMSP